MDLIHINRNIFNKLKDNKILVKEYLKDLIIQVDTEEILLNDYDNLTDGLYTIIFKNEDLIEKVGMKNYYHNNYDLKDHVESAWYRTGKYGLIAFDWAMSDENDTMWSYSFNVFKVL